MGAILAFGGSGKDRGEGLGAWTQLGNTTCPSGWSSHEVSLDGCVVECLGRDDCDGVSVKWSTTSHDIVSCQLLDSKIKPSDCQTADGDHSAFFRSLRGAMDIVVV